MTDTSAAGSILLVDDDKFLVDMYAMKFSKAGYTVHASLSVDDALQTLRGGFPADVVLFDIIMPGKDGFALLEALRGEHLAQEALRIALTNENQQADHEHAEMLGATGFIVKSSMIPSEVVNTVAAEMTKRRSA